MKKTKDQVWFVYDGDCPMCNGAVNAFMIKKAVMATIMNSILIYYI